MRTLLYTVRDAAEASGLTEATVRKYVGRYLVLGTEYIMHRRLVARSDGAKFLRRQRLITESGLFRLAARQFGPLYERSAGRLRESSPR